MATTSSGGEVQPVDDVDVVLDGSMFRLKAVRRVPRDLRDVLDPWRSGDCELVAQVAVPGYALAQLVRAAAALLVATCVDLSPADPCSCGSPLQVQSCHGQPPDDAGW